MVCKALNRPWNYFCLQKTCDLMVQEVWNEGNKTLLQNSLDEATQVSSVSCTPKCMHHMVHDVRRAKKKKKKRSLRIKGRERKHKDEYFIKRYMHMYS